MTGRDLLLRTLLLRRLLLRNVLSKDEKCVGLLLPPSVGGALANAALPLCGRVPVNLNYTVSADVMNHCIRESGIRHVLTSRRVMQKLGLKIDAELVYLEDFKSQVKLRDKMAAYWQATWMPLRRLERRMGVRKLQPDDVLTIIFTSGSTGEPKGVMLTNRNIASNVHGIDQAVQLVEHDVLLGALPFFHSFGYTATLWTVLNLSPKGVFHYSPLESREIGKLIAKHQATILMSTPTFLRSYIKRIPPEELRSLELVIVGAEKLPKDLSDAFQERFAVRPLEGYGTTELSPLVSVNIPKSRSRTPDRELSREGSVGRPIDGVEARIVHPETGEELGPNDEGMLQIRGPNVMLGYLNKPQETAKVMKDGWYVTGDMARLDPQGFIWITGRLNRFSKIGGEMVPHLKVEEVLQKFVAPDADELKLAVTAVPDPRKGERLIVLHTEVDRTPEEMVRALSQAGLPNLFIPSADSFRQVEAIPVLGTGKLDLRRLKELAQHEFLK